MNSEFGIRNSELRDVGYDDVGYDDEGYEYVRY